MDLLTIDFETYYDDDYTLSSMTTESYIRDARFETIGVGVTTPEGRCKWFEHDQFVKAAAKLQWDKIAVLCHHAHFDGLILNHHYGIRPGFIFDTLSMANALHGQTRKKSLGSLMEHYGVGVKGDEVIHAKGKHRADFTRAEWEQYGRYCLNDCDGTYGIFRAMLPQFSRTELDLIDTTVRMFTEPTLVLDEKQMGEYLVYERARKAELLARVGEDKSVFMSNDKFAQLLLDMGVAPQMKATKRKQKDGTYKHAETFAFAKTDSFMQSLLEHEDDDIRFVAEARVGVKSTGNETRTERFLKAGAGGRPMPVYIRYAAAHTHRWGGADGMNWQNLQRVNKKKPMTGVIRKSVRAPAGHKLVVADSSQIEARITAYLAGETWMVDAFAQGRDVYSEMASELYQRPVDRKNNPDDEFAGFVGKVAVLGYGFGLGWFKAAQSFLAGPMGAPPVQFTVKDCDALGISGGSFLNNPKKVERVEQLLSRLPRKELLVHCIVSEEFVKRYRAKNQRIAGKNGLWKYMETILGWMNEGVECDAGLPVPVRVFRHGLQLDGFNAMHYPGLEYDGNEYSYLGGKSGKERVRTHGPAMTENIVQYLARCAVAGQMVEYKHRVPAARIALMSHDEVGSVVPEAMAVAAYETKLQIMKTSPTWAHGLPLNAEGGFGDVYGEIK